jgi:hypothetical protein
MAERYAFPVRYDEATMRTAVTGFVTRALLRDAPLKTLLPIALIFLSCAGLYFGGDDELAGEIFVVASVVLAVFLLAGWRMHWRALREKIAAARGRFFMAHLRDEGIVIDGLAPEALLEWKNIRRSGG